VGRCIEIEGGYLFIPKALKDKKISTKFDFGRLPNFYFNMKTFQNLQLNSYIVPFQENIMQNKERFGLVLI
jgi:hypothetical protein